MNDWQIQGMLTSSDIDALVLTAREIKHQGTIVEIGSFMGLSTVILASTRPDCTVISIERMTSNQFVYQGPCGNTRNKKIEPWWPDIGKSYDVRTIFLKNIEPFDNIITLTGAKPTDLQYKFTEVDFFFLDAAHTNPWDLNYINFFLPLMSKNSLFGGHDYFPDEDLFPDIKANINYLQNNLNTQVIRPHPKSSIWLFKIS